MKTIQIKVTEEEYKRLREIALDLTEYASQRFHFPTKVSHIRILEQFVSDLTASDRSLGSDERNYASDWLYRAGEQLP